MISYTRIKELVNECEWIHYIGGYDCTNEGTEAIVEWDEEHKNIEPSTDDVRFPNHCAACGDAWPCEPSKGLHIGHLCDGHIDLAWNLVNKPENNYPTDIGDLPDAH